MVVVLLRRCQESLDRYWSGEYVLKYYSVSTAKVPDVTTTTTDGNRENILPLRMRCEDSKTFIAGGERGTS